MGWVVLGSAVAAGGMTGFWLRRWAAIYAMRLDAGAPATASTLWGAAAAAGAQSVRWAPDGAAAVLLGGVAGWLALDGALNLVPLALGLAALAWLDAHSGLLPDALTGPLMVLGWGLGTQHAGVAAGASALTWLVLTGLAWLYRRWRGRDGFGGGDAKCLAALAGWLGLDAAAGILWLACVLGVLVWLGRRHGWHDACPFGPCIALAAGLWLLTPCGIGPWGAGPGGALAVQSWF